MAWDIGSILTSRGASATGSRAKGSTSKRQSTQQSQPQFNTLRNRLLLSYLLIIAVVLGAFSVAVYLLVARDRNQQLNSSLKQVATTSVGSFEIIQHEYLELITGEDDDEVAPEDEITDEEDPEDEIGDYGRGNNVEALPIPISLSEFMGRYNARSTAPSPSNHSSATPYGENHSSVPISSPLSLNNQGVEWFNAQRQLMVWEGERLSSSSLPTAIATNGLLTQDDHIRSFILPIYKTLSQDLSSLANNPIGYVRASQSTLRMEQDLRRLREILGIGVVIVSGVVTVGGLWLTRESIRPVLTSFDQLKQFTSDASHELRNPLTAIRASVAVMQSHPERIHPDDADKIKAIASASTQMSKLVDDLLLLARMDRAAPNQKAWRRIALDEVLEDLVNLYSDRARQAQIGLHSQLDMSLEVNGDATQIQRLFTNLLANALQYTPAGGKITISLHHAGSEAMVQFQDTGIGITPDQLPHLFDRFWRADQARSHHAGGTGLGLAISLAIAQRHGGNITVQSQVGKGSCFNVKIPLS